MRSSSIVYILALAAQSGLASAACASPACTSCPTSQDCANFQGCVDKSPGDYDASFCVEGQGVFQEEETLEPCDGSLAMGAIGGVFAFILPCCLLCNRRRRQHSQWMLTAPDTVVKRVTAEVKRSWTESSGGGEAPSTTFYLQVVFQALRSDGSVLNVDAEMKVFGTTYDKAAAAKQLQVAYEVNDERSLEAVSDLEYLSNSRSGAACVMCAIPVFFGGIGLLGGAISGPVTGCYLGYAPFVALVLAGVVVGQFVMAPLMRKNKVAFSKISVTPATSSSAIVLGVAASP